MLPPYQARFRASRVIHAAMVGSLVVYAGLVHALASGVVGWQPVLSPRQAVLARWILYLAAAVGVLAVLVRRARDLSPETLAVLARRAGADAVLRQLQTRWILLMTLAESIGVGGLVLFLLGGRLGDFYGLWAAALACQLALAPRREAWEAAARGGGPSGGAGAR